MKEVEPTFFINIGIPPDKKTQFVTSDMEVYCAIVPCRGARTPDHLAQMSRAGRAWMTDVEGRARISSPLVRLCRDYSNILYHRERAFREYDEACRDYESIVSWLRDVDPNTFHQIARKQKGKYC